MKIWRSGVAAFAAAFAVVMLSAFTASSRWVFHAVLGPLNVVVSRAWLDTTTGLLMFPPSVLLISLAALLAFCWGVNGKVD